MRKYGVGTICPFGNFEIETGITHLRVECIHTQHKSMFLLILFDENMIKGITFH